MLSLSKHLYRTMTLGARERCFNKLSMTVFFQPPNLLLEQLVQGLNLSVVAEH